MTTTSAPAQPQSQPLTRPEWIDKAYQVLCLRTGAPENDTIERHMREWAEVMAASVCNYFSEGTSPEDAVAAELAAF
jgi:hypothetical protein